MRFCSMHFTLGTIRVVLSIYLRFGTHIAFYYICWALAKATTRKDLRHSSQTLLMTIFIFLGIYLTCFAVDPNAGEDYSLSSISQSGQACSGPRLTLRSSKPKSIDHVHCAIFVSWSHIKLLMQTQFPGISAFFLRELKFFFFFFRMIDKKIAKFIGGIWRTWTMKTNLFTLSVVP